FSFTSGDLTTITDPDTGTHTFAYSGTLAHHLTSETFGALQNQWGYAAGGTVSTLTWGSASSPSVTTVNPAALQGLTAPVAGTVQPTATDALGIATGWTLDNAGRPLAQFNPDAGIEVWTRDSNGRVLTDTDPLGRVTTYARDAQGYVTLETLPDSSTIASA